MPEMWVGVSDYDGNRLQLGPGGALPVTPGMPAALVTLGEVDGDAEGDTVDAGAIRATATFVAVGTGDLEGTLTLEGSLDGTIWLPTAATATMTPAGTVSDTHTGVAYRYYRVNLSGSTDDEGGTITAWIAAA